jgi:hypothetical protein
MVLFTDELIEEYSDQLTTMSTYSFYNYTAFYAWWNPVRNSDKTLLPAAITRQESIEMLKASCRDGIEEPYIKTALDKIKSDPKYDFLAVINNSLPFSTQEQKIKAVTGFIISRLGECRPIENVYCANLICAKPQNIPAKILMGAFLYCIKNTTDPKIEQLAILELAGGYTNIAGFFSYTKMGFDKNLDLYGMNCFTEFTSLPMSANVNEMTSEQIVGYTTTLQRTNVKDDTGLFKTGIPANDEQRRLQPIIAEIAQDLYVIQLANTYPDDQDTKLQDTIEKYNTNAKTALVSVKRELQQHLRLYNPRSCTLFGCKLFGGRRTRRYKRVRNRYLN